MNVGCSEYSSESKDCIDEKMKSGELYIVYAKCNLYFIISNGCNALQMEMCSPSITNHHPNIQRRLSSRTSHSADVIIIVCIKLNIFYHRRFATNHSEKWQKGRKKRHRNCFVLRQCWTSNIQHHIVISASPRCLPNSISIIIDADKCRPVNGQYTNNKLILCIYIHIPIFCTFMEIKKMFVWHRYRCPGIWYLTKIMANELMMETWKRK